MSQEKWQPYFYGRRGPISIRELKSIETRMKLDPRIKYQFGKLARIHLSIIQSERCQ